MICMTDLNWYYTLNQPPLMPPGWIFPPVWAILYTLIFIAFISFVTKRTNKPKLWGYILFFIQLVLNFMWVPMFFGMHNVFGAFVIIIMLDFSVFYNIREFFLVSKKSACFLIPYFVWILFATYLNIGVLVLN